MNDVTNAPQTAVVLGGSSDLARALMCRLASGRLRSVLLAGRDEPALRAVAKELRALGVSDVEAARFDVLDIKDHERFAMTAKSQLGTIDLLVVAVGLLGTGALDKLDAGQVATSIDTNFAGPAAAMLTFAKLMRAQGYGRIIVFSSVAGVRVRRSNFVYGAAKAGLDGFCQGLADALVETGVKLLIVRPGFVHTKMTAGHTPAPFAVSADDVATAVLRGLDRGDELVWVPRGLATAFSILKWLPRRLWRLLPG